MSSKNYEALAVYSIVQGEEKAQELQARFQTLVEQNGTVETTDTWGTRRLAYAINDEPQGYYVLYRFAAEPEFPAELDRVLKITDGVLRSLITVRPEEKKIPAAKKAENVVETTEEAEE
ncbi:MAG: 30S ribosomal protein S6 [Oscillospiraceae bacterium]|jgi:small subunit ribosomal protein S6|nr:30S ribosomal protein S6 [Oscillospiraceae bacterium]